jgi:hypothetical protein
MSHRQLRPVRLREPPAPQIPPRRRTRLPGEKARQHRRVPLGRVHVQAEGRERMQGPCRRTRTARRGHRRPRLGETSELCGLVQDVWEGDIVVRVLDGEAREQLFGEEEGEVSEVLSAVFVAGGVVGTS